jgi:O-antigen ligase
VHTVEVVAEGGHGQWVLVDWRVGGEPIRDGYGWQVTGLMVAGLVLVVLLVRDARRVEWGALARRFLGWPEWAQAALVVGPVGLLWSTASVSWGRDWGSPWFVVSLLTLPALITLFALRLDLGLGLVALTAPFYLCPGDMFYDALSLPEILVLLCLLANAGLGQSAQTCKRRIGAIRANLQTSLLDRAVLLLVLAVVVAGLAADDWRAALFEVRAVFLLPALYYVLLRLARLDDQARWQIVGGFVLGAVGVAVIGLGQYVLGRNVVVAEGGLPRLQSVYHSPNNVGLYLGRVWPLLVAVALWGKRRRRQVFYGLALVVVMLALGLSFSRGALLLGVPAASLVMGWRAGGRYRWVVLVLVVIGVLVLIPLMRMPRFASLLDLQAGSTFFRLELWRSSLALIREHPWFGVGPGNFLDAYRTRYVLPSAWQEFNLEHPHNVYLDHWTRLGLLGLLAGTAVQVAFWRQVRREREKALVIGFTGSMVVLLAHGLVDNTLFFPDLALAFFLTLALVQGNKNLNEEEM